MKQLGIITAIIAAMFLSTIWSGFVLTQLWAWFIVPVFGLPTLSLVYAVGLSLIVGYLTHQLTPASGKEVNEQLMTAGWYTFIRPLVFLGVGFVVTLFM